jgi:hypothetical protein
MNDFIEQKIITAIKELLVGHVNELLGEVLLHIPLIEFSDYTGCDVIVPVVELSGCERTEKDRIIKVDAYSLTVSFSVPDSAEAELYCFAYATALHTAIDEDRTLGSLVERAVVTGKNYVKPKNANCGGKFAGDRNASRYERAIKKGR